jgi:hypothetical protein
MAELTCTCGETVSVPDKKSVEETMARHKAKKHKGAKK